MNTFNRVYKAFPDLLDRIAAGSPDYIVPVARKGCKLLRASSPSGTIKNIPVRYRTYFEMHPRKLAGAKVAILDDATQHTATLLEYRKFFEHLGAKVETYSFVGHDSLSTGTRWMCDPETHVEVFLPEPVYQEYILQQAAFLLSANSHFDLDHLVLRYDLPSKEWDKFAFTLKRLGCLLEIEDVLNRNIAHRFALTDISFFESSPYICHPSVSLGAIRKLKFVTNPSNDAVFFSPLVFPTWHYGECERFADLVRNVPFELPFPEATSMRNDRRPSLLKNYFNLRFVATASFAKAFSQELACLGFSSESLAVRSTDLDSVLGPESAGRLNASLKSFLDNPDVVDFNEVRETSRPPIEPTRKYRSFAQLIDHAKRRYETKIKERRTRIGVHHFIGYDELAVAFTDRLLLDEGLDFYCDLGVLVPETVFKGGRIERACRTGEPTYDYSWDRTGVIIPLAIDQLCQLSECNDGGAPPMVLDKALACFAFDYPMQSHQQLHCLTSRPYTFGAYVSVYHTLRASQSTPLHTAAQHAKYYWLDRKTNKFYIKGREKLLEAMKKLFDNRQEVPYSEIVNYFSMLAVIASRPGKVDNLNALSICREENYFYSHVLYNLRSWVACFGESLDDSDDLPVLDSIRRASKEISSARSKMKMARGFPSLMAGLREDLRKDMRFLIAWQHLEANYRPFSEDFFLRLQQLQTIVDTESILSAYCMACLTGERKRWTELAKTDWIESLRTVGVDTSALTLLADDAYAYSRSLVAEGYGVVFRLMSALPREEPLLETLLSMHAVERAKNVAMNLVRKLDIKVATLIFLDLSGLRDIPEPKATIVSKFYTIVDSCVTNRMGFTIYGGRGGNDEYTILFTGTATALEFARDVKQQFEGDLYLADYDIKFGMTLARLDGSGAEGTLIRAWGEAKDACTLKTETLKNRGELLVPQSTYDALSDGAIIDVGRLFETFCESGISRPAYYKYRFDRGSKQ